MASTSAQIQVSEPRVFTAGAIAITSAYGLVGLVPVFISFLMLSVLGFKFSALLIGLAMIAIVIWLLPLASGNPYVTKLVRSISPANSEDSNGFIVQITLSPRLRSDLRALAEDADDIGYLTADDSRLFFQGDSIKLSVPFAEITRVERKYRGLRSLFVPRIVVTVPGPLGSLEFGERAAALLPASRRTSNRIYKLLLEKCAWNHQARN
jgi:hypothetical protein